MTFSPRLFTALVPMLLVATGCDPEVVLAGNFEQFSQGPVQGTNITIPGHPDGDRIIQFGHRRSRSETWYPLAKEGSQITFRDDACSVGQSCFSPARFVHFVAKSLTAQQANNPFTWVLGGDAYLTPGCELNVAFSAGHAEPVAELHFEGPSIAGGDGTVSFEHGDGVDFLQNISPGESFAYGVRADPSTATMDLGGSDALDDLLVIDNPSGTGRSIVLTFHNPVASGCYVALDGLEALAEN